MRAARPRLRLLLAVPRARGAPRGGPGRDRGRGAGQVAPGASSHAAQRLTAADVAERAGVDIAAVEALISMGLLVPGPAGGFTPGDVRLAWILDALTAAGLPMDAVAGAVRGGLLPLDFKDEDVYRRFASLTDETFAAASERTGVPLEVLAVLREASGWGPFDPNERLREDERDLLPWLETQVRLGFRPPAIERLLRAMGDSLRRIAEAEAEWFRSEIMEPYLRQGRAPEITRVDPDNRLSDSGETAMLAMFRAQEAQTWLANMRAGFERQLAQSGMYEAARRQPAICFLDVTGYTRLTQERGDDAAAALAEQLARLVKRTSGEHGGRPVKWLGDGVMCFFEDPGRGVVAALEMVAGIPAAGLPPAHVGLHAGPVVTQQGDYYGQTVNMAARIADYARPGEVLVSRAVVDAASGGEGRPEPVRSLAFSPIGAVELKGVSGTTELFAARRLD